MYRTRLVVSDKAIDMLGHANNIAYVRWMQDVAVRHSEHVGLPWETYVKLGAAFVIRRQDIEYLRPVRKGETIEIATWIVSMGRASSVRATEMRSSDGALVLKAETTWIFVSLSSGRPMEIPENVRTLFALKETVEQDARP